MKPSPAQQAVLDAMARGERLCERDDVGGYWRGNYFLSPRGEAGTTRVQRMTVLNLARAGLIRLSDVTPEGFSGRVRQYVLASPAAPSQPEETR